MQFLTGFTMGAVFPYLAIYFAGRVGEVMTGLMLMAVVLSGLVGGLVGGFISDQIGRKQLMVWSEFGVGMVFIVIAFLNSPWYSETYGTFGLLLLSMLFGGVLGPTSQAMVLDVTTSENRRYVFTLMYWVNNVSMALAGMLGAFLFANYLFQLFLAVAALSILSAWITSRFIIETYKRPEQSKGKEKTSIWNNYKPVFQNKTFLAFLGAGVLIFALEEQLTNYLAVRFSEVMSAEPLLPFGNGGIGVDGTLMLGILRTENTVLVVFIATFVTWMVRKWENKSILIVGITIYTIGYAVFTLTHTPWLLMVMMLLVTLGELMYYPVAQSMLGDLPPDDAKSSYMAVYEFTFYSATFVAGVGIMLGSVIPSFGMGILYVLFGATGLFLYLHVNEKLKEKETLPKAVQEPTQTSNSS